MMFLGIVILMSINEPLKPLKWNTWLSIPWTVCGVLLLIVCLLFDMGSGFLAFAISMLILFPCLYLIWNNRCDYDVLFSMLARAMVANLFLVFLACVIFGSVNVETMQSGRYMGITRNPNNLGMIMSSSVVCCLYLIFRNEKTAWLYILASAIAVSLLVFSASRTALLSILLQFGVFAIFYVRCYMKEQDIRKAMIKVCLILVLVLAFIPINQVVLSNEIYVHSGEKESVVAQSRQQLPLQGGFVLNRFRIEKGDWNGFSSGRLDIWKAYLQKVGWKGHQEDEIVLVNDKNPTWAHNTFIEFAYRFGIGIGLFYLFLAIYSGVYAYRCIISKEFYRTHSYCAFSVFSTLSFCVASMFEMEYFPLARDCILLYYIGITPLFQSQALCIEDAL